MIIIIVMYFAEMYGRNSCVENTTLQGIYEPRQRLWTG